MRESPALRLPAFQLHATRPSGDRPDRQRPLASLSTATSPRTQRKMDCSATAGMTTSSTSGTRVLARSSSDRQPRSQLQNVWAAEASRLRAWLCKMVPSRASDTPCGRRRNVPTARTCARRPSYSWPSCAGTCRSSSCERHDMPWKARSLPFAASPRSAGGTAIHDAAVSRIEVAAPAPTVPAQVWPGTGGIRADSQRVACETHLQSPWSRCHVVPGPSISSSQDIDGVAAKCQVSAIWVRAPRRYRRPHPAVAVRRPGREADSSTIVATPSTAGRRACRL
jgi:hypothetical protein